MVKTSERLKKVLKTIGKAADIVAVAFLCLILVFNLYVAMSKIILKNDMPKFLGYANAIIVTPSMSGTIEVNDMIITRSRSLYEVGDIITYKDGKDYITHRIDGITDNGEFITKGDANNSPDITPVQSSQIVGKVVLVIPKIGVFIHFLRTPIGILFIVFIGAVLIYLPSFINKINKSRKSIDKSA